MLCGRAKLLDRGWSCPSVYMGLLEFIISEHLTGFLCHHNKGDLLDVLLGLFYLKWKSRVKALYGSLLLGRLRVVINKTICNELIRAYSTLVSRCCSWPWLHLHSKADVSMSRFLLLTEVRWILTPIGRLFPAGQSRAELSFRLLVWDRTLDKSNSDSPKLCSVST